jgi:hypothetical protein
VPESLDSYDLAAADHPEPAAAAFQPIPVAVQSFSETPVINVAGPEALPGLAGLESFLSAIQRARRDTLSTTA